MAPPRKPAPKSAAYDGAPRSGGRGRPPQGDAGQGRNAPSEPGRGRSATDSKPPRGPRSAAPAGRYEEAPREGRRGAPGEPGRGRAGSDAQAPRGPRSAAPAGRYEEASREGRRGAPAEQGRGRAGSDAQAPRGPRSAAPAGRYDEMPRDGRRAAPADSKAPRGPRGAAQAGRNADQRNPEGRTATGSRVPRNAPAAAGGDDLRSHGFGSIDKQRHPGASQPQDAEARREARKAAGRKPPVNIAELPVEPAKKLRMRHGSEKHERQALELREKRVEARHIGELRIQKALALSGVGSRRDCDEWVSAGRVSINGEIVQPGARVAPGDRVLFDGKPILIKWPDRLPRIVLYHKQEGELVSRDDPAGRTTVFERLPKVQSSAWIAVGRLDFNTSGLLIFTTSGDLANRLMHPRFEVQREYAVRILGQLSDEQKKELVTGIELEDGTARFEVLEDQGGEGMNHWYRVILKEGRNREVRRMFEHYELTVSRLMRVRFGMLTLPSRLKRGQYYELDEPEVLAVLKWAGLSLTGRVPTR
ncbi:pseudouridine synthase [Chitinimonas sp. JJ19]|uniref:pseudouridine synthase n=1 Tax=Chitinimonas sp. JJ19 TaxID=3109352 RepID=UPI0030009087